MTTILNSPFEKDTLYKSKTVINSPYGDIEKGRIFTGEQWQSTILYEVGVKSFPKMFEIVDDTKVEKVYHVKKHRK